jgi:hypothetical protein
MVTHELEVSILAAPLNAMDRRALSQAWYSALRLACNTPVKPISTRIARDPNSALNGASLERRLRQGRERNAFVGVLTRRRQATPGVNEAIVALRPPSRTLARQIEHAFVDKRSLPRRATFSMGRGRARVHVILQTNETQTTLLALCRPELRTTVSHALSQARLALARRGIGLELRGLEEAICS